MDQNEKYNLPDEAFLKQDHFYKEVLSNARIQNHAQTVVNLQVLHATQITNLGSRENLITVSIEGAWWTPLHQNLVKKHLL